MIGKRTLLGFACALSGLALPATTQAIVDAATGDEEPTVVVTVTPIRPYQPGDLVWTSSPPPPAPTADSMDVGCDRVPATGYIGTNVYADSGAHYANFWNWGPGSSGEAYYWYVKKTDGTTQANGYASGGGNASVPANIYRWKCPAS